MAILVFSSGDCFVLVAALMNMGACLMENGQFEKALLLLERGLSINRENLPGEHLDLASGEIIQTMQDFMTYTTRNELVAS